MNPTVAVSPFQLFVIYFVLLLGFSATFIGVAIVLARIRNEFTITRWLINDLVQSSNRERQHAAPADPVPPPRPPTGSPPDIPG
mgnify:CR=1 FL=1